MEEILTNEQGTEVVNNSEDYISAINEMRKNTVSRSEYDKLKEDNRKLLQSLVNGETITPEVAKEPVDVGSLRKDLFNNDHTNLDFAKKALELRNAVMEQGGEDPFLPQGHYITLTAQDYEVAQKVANAFEHCIEYADGNSEIFTNELMRITQDSFRPNLNKNIKRR